MKNLILSIIVCLCAYSFSACTDDAVLQSDMNPSLVKTKSIETGGTYYVTEDGSLNFSSGEIFFNTNRLLERTLS